MTSMERVLTALGFNEPDRVPMFLLLTMHGARELGLSIRDYFSRHENVVRGQELLQKKYDNDCLYTFHYASIEVEARGGEVIYLDDGPPQAGQPIISKPEQIESLEPLEPAANEALRRVLSATEELHRIYKDTVPIIGVVMSPFSLPVMQMGFGPYLDLMYDRPELFQRLMEVNTRSCIAYANAQLEAGATAICYFDPVSSPTIIEPHRYLRTGHTMATEFHREVNGPFATHLASGAVLPILDDLIETGTNVIGVSCMENLRELKARCHGRVTLLGNLNGIRMCRWTQDEAEAQVRDAVAAAGKGGGFILSDNHGEIPFQVRDEILQAISESRGRWGEYPLSDADTET